VLGWFIRLGTRTSSCRELGQLDLDLVVTLGGAIGPGREFASTALVPYQGGQLAGRGHVIDRPPKPPTMARKHIVPELGALKAKDLRASHVERWLHGRRAELSTRSLRLVHGLLNRSMKRALARDSVARNVVDLVEVPDGRPGRPSKSLTVVQAEALLVAAERSPLYAYVVVSLMTGGRTEEMRPLTWSNTHLEADHSTDPPLPPRLQVYRSVRQTGDTKTRRSRRSLALPGRCIEVLSAHRHRQAEHRIKMGDRWKDNDLVFASEVGTQLDAANVRRAFREAIEEAPGIEASEWTPRELRHSFVSLLSDRGVPIEEISRLVGHSSTLVTETVYRHQLRPVIETGAQVMDDLFGPDAE
jgi:integrase